MLIFVEVSRCRYLDRFNERFCFHVLFLCPYQFKMALGIFMSDTEIMLSISETRNVSGLLYERGWVKIC
jgi:hypothetical protein